MNLVDLVIAIVILLSIWGGWRRGFFIAGSDLVALVLSLICAFLAYPALVGLIERAGIEGGVWTPPLAFIAIYIVVRLVLGWLFRRLLQHVPRAAHAHRANHVFGLVPGAANGLINGAIVALLLVTLPLTDRITREARESVLAERFAEPAEWLEARVRPIFEPAVERTLSRLIVPPDSRASVKLPFTVQKPRHRPDLEEKMLALVNEERRQHGLAPLQADPEAAAVARAHSIDMFARGYFSHVTPDGQDPFARMRAGKVRFRVAGENLALARTLPMAHQGLMDSPGHRANILRPHFGRVGIGIVDGGRYGLMVTQKFRN